MYGWTSVKKNVRMFESLSKKGTKMTSSNKPAASSSSRCSSNSRRAESRERIRLKQITPSPTYYREHLLLQSKGSSNSRSPSIDTRQSNHRLVNPYQTPKDSPKQKGKGKVVMDPLILKYSAGSGSLSGFCYEQTQSAPDLRRGGERRGNNGGVSSAGSRGRGVGLSAEARIKEMKKNPEKELKLLNAKIVSEQQFGKEEHVWVNVQFFCDQRELWFE